MITLYQIGPAGYWTGQTQQVEDDAVVPSGWTARPLPEGLQEGQHVRLTLAGWEITTDPAPIAIETSLGNVDARISTQLEAVRAGLDEMAKIRAFEMQDRLTTEPVEVPGDPEFHARILAAEAEARLAEAAAKAHH